MTVTIDPVQSADLGDVRRLFREYEAAIGIDLCFQGFEEELASLPGRYAGPRGALFIARDAGEPVGCVGLRPMADQDICEMKRLYVRAKRRGTGLGRQLIDCALEAARLAGYRAMRLDTLENMTAAQRLYRELGFREIPAYYPNPLPGVKYFELDLLSFFHQEQGHESCDHRPV